MNNVVPFKRPGFLADYDSQNSESRIDNAVFFGGVLMAVVLPEIIYCAFRGPVPPFAFAGSALLGTILGVTLYRRFPYRMLSCVDKGTVPQVSSGEDTTLPNAA